MILQVLRAQTTDLHDRMEAIGLSKRMLAEDVTPAEYAEFLASHYALMASLEPMLDAFFSTNGGSYRSAGKFRQIEADLKELGAALPEAMSVSELPALRTTAHAWGAAYVIEGAAMGGMVLHRALSGRPQLAGSGAFLYLSGGQVPPPARWKAFCEDITAAVVDEAAQQEALAAARETYEAMGRSLERHSAAV